MAYGINHRILGQIRPQSAGPKDAIRIAAESLAEVVVKSINISNNTDADQWFSVFCALGGAPDEASFSEDHALAFKLPIRARSMVHFTGYYAISELNQAFGVESSAAGAITFSFFGGSIPLP